MKILVTGCFGFLGHALCERMLADGHSIVGVDRLDGANSDKSDRLDIMEHKDFEFAPCNISNNLEVVRVFRKYNPSYVIHFAAQYSLPHDTDLLKRYYDSNVLGFINMIEQAKLHKVERFIYASSYIAERSEQAWSMYSISKAFNELMAEMYSRRFNMKTLGIRYGSVFGPKCRKDTAPAMLARKYLSGEAISFSGRQLLKTPFLDVRDAANITYSSVFRPLPEKFNVFTAVANDNRYSLNDLLYMMESIVGKEAVVRGEREEFDPVFVDEENIKEMERISGVTPKYAVGDTLADFLESWNP